MSEPDRVCFSEETDTTPQMAEADPTMFRGGRTLLDLPNEVLFRFIDEVQPQDLVNLTLCCRGIYNLTTKALVLHAKRSAEFSKLVLRLWRKNPWLDDMEEPPRPYIWDYGIIGSLDPFKLLQNIDRDERIALYTHTLEVNRCEQFKIEPGIETNSNGGDLMPTSPKFRSSMDVMKYIPRVLRRIERNHKVLPPYCYNSESGNASRGEEQDFATCVLLMSLPNLRTLKIGGLFHHSVIMEYLFRFMASGGNDHARPLAQLTDVTLQGRDYDMHEEQLPGPALRDSSLMRDIMCIPAVKKVTATCICDEDYRNDESLWYKTMAGCNNVEHIRFCNVDISPQNIIKCLDLAGNLRIVDFEHPANPHDFYEGVEAILRALIRYAKHSLVHLRIVHPQEWWIGDHKPPAFSFRPFIRLKRLTWHLHYFYLGRAQDWPPEGATQVMQQENRIVMLLPSSIEQVFLLGYHVLR